MKIALGFALAALCVVGCSTNSKPVPDDLKKQSAPEASKSATDGKREYGSSAMSGQAEPAATDQSKPAGESTSLAPAAGASAGSANGLAFQAPSGWTKQTPSSQMRAAQYALPATGGEAPELVLFFFGTGQGGTVDDNISRWINQVKQPDGSDSAAKAKSAKREAGALKVTTVVVDGTYNSGGMMGTPTVPKENYRLWGAVIEGPGGPWFWKATGPKAAMDAQMSSFDAFLASMHTQ